MKTLRKYYRLWKKGNLIVWNKRYGKLCERFYYMAYGGKKSAEWVNRNQNKLYMLSIKKIFG